MRTLIALALSAVLVVGAASVTAQTASPAPSASTEPGLLVSPDPSADPCASPAPSSVPGPAESPALSAAPSGVPEPASPVPSVDPAGSPVPSPAPSVDPCASPSLSPSPEPTDAPVVGFRPNRVKVTLKKIADGLPSPVYVTGTGDGSGDLFVIERAGRIRILTRNGKLEPFLDLRDRVDTLNERGLHAMALHPRYRRNGRFYVHYNSPDGDTNIVEFTARPGRGEVRTGTARTILRLNQPFENHNGGWIGFGPDGMLYIALGDGGGNDPGDPLGNGQRRSTMLAKILRIDVDGSGRYGIPRDNPFARGQKGFAPETFAWGLRNPWRASFDRETGDLWIGDVGQKATEEIDLVRAGRSGLNFGWSVMEGSQCHRGACDRSAFVLPVSEYRHGADGCSVVGGYVYRGKAEPLLHGAYLFSDYCSGRIWGIRAADGKAGAQLEPKLLYVASGTTPVSFGEDDEGELYLVSLGGGIYRIGARPKG